MKHSYFPDCTLRNKAKDLDNYARACAEKPDILNALGSICGDMTSTRPLAA